MIGSVSTREAARIVGLSESEVRTLLRSGLDRPRGRGRHYALSFRDLVVLRSARALRDRAIPTTRIRRALRSLAAGLPAHLPMSGLRIFAEGGRVAVSDGERQWNPETGQTSFAFSPGSEPLWAESEGAGSEAAGDPDSESDARPPWSAAWQPSAFPELEAPLPRPATPGPQASTEAERLFERALQLELQSPDSARSAYQAAIALDPDLTDAAINLGRLEHEGGRVLQAILLYEAALERAPHDAIIHFNLALAFEDLSGADPAAAHYEQALELDPEFADAHFNLARVCERLARFEDAVRHFDAYERLMRP